jgi:hypothetical protein
VTLRELHDHIGGYLSAGANPNMPVEVPGYVHNDKSCVYAPTSKLSAYVTPNNGNSVDRFVIMPAEWVEST